LCLRGGPRAAAGGSTLAEGDGRKSYFVGRKRGGKGFEVGERGGGFGCKETIKK